MTGTNPINSVMSVSIRNLFQLFRKSGISTPFKPSVVSFYLKYDANKYTRKMVEAQMKGHKKDVATYHRLKEVSLGDAERLLAAAGNVELDHRYPEGFYDAMVDVVDSRLTDIESKSYANKDADVVLLKGLRTEMGG